MTRATCSLICATLMICAAAAAADTADGWATTADGLSIHYVAGGRGDLALVFVHGWSCDASYWNAQLASFAAKYRVVAIDLAGHGSSDIGREEWSMAAFGADVKAVVEALDLERVALVGHSMGGAVIAEAALAMPSRVCGLVGVDNFQKVSIDLSPEQINGFLGFLKTDFQVNVNGWVHSMFPADADTTLVKLIATDMASAPADVGIGAMAELLDWYTNDAPDALARLGVPLHCINTDKNPTDADALRAVVPGYELHLMPGHGHFLMREDPDRFNELLEASIETLCSAK